LNKAANTGGLTARHYSRTFEFCLTRCTRPISEVVYFYNEILAFAKRCGCEDDVKKELARVLRERVESAKPYQLIDRQFLLFYFGNKDDVTRKGDVKRENVIDAIKDCQKNSLLSFDISRWQFIFAQYGNLLTTNDLSMILPALLQHWYELDHGQKTLETGAAVGDMYIGLLTCIKAVFDTIATIDKSKIQGLYDAISAFKERLPPACPLGLSSHIMQMGIDNRIIKPLGELYASALSVAEAAEKSARAIVKVDGHVLCPPVLAAVASFSRADDAAGCHARIAL
jgi:hypothetical protein